MIKFFKMLAGIVLIPSCWAVSVATYNLYQGSGNALLSTEMEGWALPAGFIIWVVIYFLLPRPSRTYVLGHELTHAMWALMMGGRVGKIKVGAAGGHVELSKTNFLITLAPYFFPFYTFLVIGAYYLAGVWLEVEPYKAWWLGVVGFSWSFHVTFTMHMLAQQQPDIQAHGRIFSYAIIYFMNVLMIGIWMVLVGAPKWLSYSELLGHEFAISYKYTWQLLILAWVSTAQWIGRLKG
jgi:hypothetical protein